MANLHFPESLAPLRTIKEIQFGLLSPEEIKGMSVVAIDNPDMKAVVCPWMGDLLLPFLNAQDMS